MTNPDAEQTGTSAQMLMAFEEYRVEKFGQYSSYPVDAFTHFAAGFRTAASQDAREALIEQCARIAEQHHEEYANSTMEANARGWGNVIARSIRAFAAPQPQAGAGVPTVDLPGHEVVELPTDRLWVTDDGKVYLLKAALHELFTTPSPTAAEPIANPSK